MGPESSLRGCVYLGSHQVDPAVSRLLRWQDGVRVVGVEPAAGRMDEVLRGRLMGGAHIRHIESNPVADGLRHPVGALNWEVPKRSDHVQAMCAVSDEEIEEALAHCEKETEMRVEHSAVVGLAAALYCKDFHQDLVLDAANRGRTLKIGIIITVVMLQYVVIELGVLRYASSRKHYQN